MKITAHTGMICAILAAALYALSSPCSKLLLDALPPTLLAGALYLGAGAGMALLGAVRRRVRRAAPEPPLTRAELPYTLGMVALDIAAPILLMLGLKSTTAANAALLNNFEIVATALIALLVFHEPVSRRLWAAIALVTLASALLSFEDASSLRLSPGSLLVLAACACWGLENNCTRALSGKDPLQIVVIKGLCSGAGSIAIGLAVGERSGAFGLLALAGLLGFVAYGLSIYFYIYAQRMLGAARTSAFYAFAPFIGAGLSLLIFRGLPGALFWAGLVAMLAGAYLAAKDGSAAETGNA